VRTKFAAAFASICLCATANGNSITPTFVTGDRDHLRAEFLVQWDALPVFGQWVATLPGAWDGGNWTFAFDIRDLGVSSGGISDGALLSYVLRTGWNDGWQPVALGPGPITFAWGSAGAAPVSLVYDQPPLIAHDFGGLGLEYYLFAGGWLDFSTATNRSGSGRIGFELIRIAAVPENGSTLLLLALAFSSAIALRARLRH
jgi:hypothetical protein